MIDAAHDHVPIVEAVNGRRVRAIVLTHGHNDHINVAVPLRDALDAPIRLHADDRMLWDVVWPGEAPDVDTEPGATITAGGHELARAAHAGPFPRGAAASTTPHAASCSPATRCSAAGPAPPGAASATSRRSSRSIRDLLLALPEETIVHTGHGESTTVGAERSGVIARAAELGV